MQRATRAAWCALLALAACGTSRSRTEREMSAVVTLDELPPRHREVWERWQKGGGHWELERERVLADPELSAFLVDNLVRSLVRSYDRSMLATAGQKSGPFERATQELVLFAPVSTPVLVELLAVRDGVVAFLAAEVLARIEAPAVEPVSKLLGDRIAETRRRAAELLARLPHGGKVEIGCQEALAERVRSDPEWIVRAEAARALGARGGRHDHKGFALGVLSRALLDADGEVVRKACEGLVLLGERRAVPPLARALRPLSARGDLQGVRAIEATLRALTRIDRPMAPEDWLDWYDAHPPPAVKPLDGR